MSQATAYQSGRHTSLDGIAQSLDDMRGDIIEIKTTMKEQGAISGSDHAQLVALEQRVASIEKSPAAARGWLGVTVAGISVLVAGGAGCISLLVGIASIILAVITLTR